MTDTGLIVSTPILPSNPALGPILQHLCASECHTYGSVLEWCETRGDCVYAVVCPECKEQFLIEECDLSDLERWTETNGTTLVCGVQLQS